MGKRPQRWTEHTRWTWTAVERQAGHEQEGTNFQRLVLDDVEEGLGDAKVSSGLITDGESVIILASAADAGHKKRAA